MPVIRKYPERVFDWMTDEQRLEAIRDELVAADHKDCTKADLLMMLEYVYICYTGEEP